MCCLDFKTLVTFKTIIFVVQLIQDLMLSHDKFAWNLSESLWVCLIELLFHLWNIIIERNGRFAPVVFIDTSSSPKLVKCSLVHNWFTLRLDTSNKQHLTKILFPSICLQIMIFFFQITFSSKSVYFFFQGIHLFRRCKLK